MCGDGSQLRFKSSKLCGDGGALCGGIAVASRDRSDFGVTSDAFHDVGRFQLLILCLRHALLGLRPS